MEDERVKDFTVLDAWVPVEIDDTSEVAFPEDSINTDNI